MHTPVLLHEVIENLRLETASDVVDATLDGGGHTREILARYPNVRILGIEWDPVEVREFREKNQDVLHRVTVVNDSYVNMRSIVEHHGFVPDAILFDLGLSSWHYEMSGRGFSFQKSEPLDMRFNPEVNHKTAALIVNTYEEEAIANMLAQYGQEQFAREIALRIVHERTVRSIETTHDLTAIIERAVPPWYRQRKIHCATKTFQALRIAVNSELENVRSGVLEALHVLRPGGRLVVISFQGLEDQIVRELFKEHARSEDITWVTRQTIRPTWEEVQANPRSRSAKMKVVQKK
jgi:16S rRNA (cytosine1402-N4)-methyltransferase